MRHTQPVDNARFNSSKFTYSPDGQVPTGAELVGYMPVYQHRPLDESKNEIRLVTVLSRDFAKNLGREGQLLCTLAHWSLDDSPVYNALSYTWGERQYSNVIWINDYAFAISDNLYTALCRIQHESAHCPVWIDAICINQQDNEEKTRQVQQMYRVYQSAKVIMVWLGPAADDSDVTLKNLEHVGKEFTAMIPAKWEDMVTKLRKSDAETAPFPMPATSALLDRSWWRRVWVQQEVAAGKDVRFLCGDRYILAGHLFYAVEIFYNMKERIMRQKNLTEYEKEVGRWSGNDSAITLLRRLPGSPHRRDHQSLIDLLYDAYVLDPVYRTPLEASDPRDLVFGLLGLATDADSLGLQPDYSKSCEEVFIDVAKAILTSGDLSLLSLSQLPKQFQSLPSWVPDWSAAVSYPIQDPRQDPGKQFDGPAMDPQPTANDYRSFSASRDSSASISITDHNYGNTILSISGVVVGTVATTTDGWTRRHKNVLASVVPFMHRISTLTNEGHDLINFLETNKEAVWRTAITDRERLSNDGYCRVRSSYFKAVHDKVIGLIERWDKIGTPEFSEFYLQDPDHGTHHYLTSLNTLAVDRRPFITEQSYIGQGPKNMQPGDLVVILFGAAVPFILRKSSDGHYQLVGEAYVYGIMDGEYLEKNAPTVKFDIH